MLVTNFVLPFFRWGTCRSYSIFRKHALEADSFERAVVVPKGAMQFGVKVGICGKQFL